MPLLVIRVIEWLLKNPWRTACLVASMICLGLWFTIYIQSIRLREAYLERNEVKAQLSKIAVDGIVQKRNIDQSQKELKIENAKQVREVKRLAGLLKNFPQDCEGAAQKAVEILRGREK